MGSCVISEEEAFLFCSKMALSTLLPVVLKSAIELNLLELIKTSGPVSASELVKMISVSNTTASDVIDRILYLLACNSILDCEAKPISDGRIERRYSLAPIAQFLTKNEDGVSMVPFLLMNFEAPLIKCWTQLKDAIVEGGVPFSKAHGMPFFEFLDTDYNFKQLFNTAMSNHSTIVTRKLIAKLDVFDGTSTLVDVGGGNGTNLNMIMSKNPNIKLGINLDLQHVLRDKPSYPGIQNVIGNMFESVPSGDAILLKWILHNWSDAQCSKLLKNCYEALPQNGKVIVVELILPNAPDPSLSTLEAANADVLMFGFCPGGKERTEDEFRTLCLNAGFKHFRLVCSGYNLLWVMEFTK